MKFTILRYKNKYFLSINFNKKEKKLIKFQISKILYYLCDFEIVFFKNDVQTNKISGTMRRRRPCR